MSVLRHTALAGRVPRSPSPSAYFSAPNRPLPRTGDGNELHRQNCNKNLVLCNASIVHSRHKTRLFVQFCSFFVRLLVVPSRVPCLRLLRSFLSLLLVFLSAYRSPSPRGRAAARCRSGGVALLPASAGCRPPRRPRVRRYA